MTYLDPMRLALSGDRARAQSHVRTARAVAFDLIRMNSEGGASTGRRTVNMPDGTEITVVQAGLDVRADIHAPEFELGEEVTIAFVAIPGATPRLLIVDVDAELISKNITGLGQIISVCCDPKKSQFVYVVNTASQLIKVDLRSVTAIGVTFTGVPFTDMFISDDGERLHMRFRATGNPLSGGFYGGVWTVSTEDLAVIATMPNTLFSAFTYRGDSHPQLPELLYLPVFGDGDLDGIPNTGHEGDSNYVPEAVEVYNYNSDAALFGDTLHEFWLASSRGFRELIIDAAGEFAYVCGTRNENFTPPGTFPLVDVSTLVVYGVEEGTLTRVGDFYVGVELNGCVAVSRTGNKIYVAEVFTDQARVLEKDDDGNYTDGAAFACRGDATTEGPPNRFIQIGPASGASVDNRIFFLSNASKTLWVFEPGADVPSKEIEFVDSPGTFALSRARRIVPKV